MKYKREIVKKPLITEFDTIIIGAGGAGLMSAISCANNGIKNVAVITKVLPILSHTVAAKGGINAALGNKDPDDWRWHAFDTIKAADGLADRTSVEYMCKSAPETIIQLEKMGVTFSRFDNGKIYQRAYGGQNTDFGKGKRAHRSCSAKDHTGHTILNSLYQKCLEKNIKFFNEFFVTDLLLENKKDLHPLETKIQNVSTATAYENPQHVSNQDEYHRKCYGVTAIDLNEGKVTIFKSKNTIIATGGYSQIYQNTTSSNICTGDGGALALKSGLQLQDMEFVQFHPTGLHGNGLLITEAARGEGGYLVNGNNERFMKNYDPERMELSSRDIISCAIVKEIEQGRGCGDKKDHIYLKLDHLDPKLIKGKLPGVINVAKSFAKIDITQDPIPVSPVAHYTMGGIPTNQNCQVTYFDKNKEKPVEGLMAIGEASCVSIHGSNRLGCNSLLDIIVFGNLSGEISAKLLSKIKENGEKDTSNTLIEEKLQNIEHILNKEGQRDIKISKIKSDLKNIMWKFTGVFKNQKLLEEGLDKLKNLQKKFHLAGINNKSLFLNDELTEYFETENLLLQSLATIHCALQRKESRGSHYREDFLEKDDKNWLCHSLFSFKNEGKKKLTFDFKTKAVRK